MQDDLQDLDVSLQKADKDTITEIIRQAENFLDAQLQAGTAADQRAITFASIIGATAAVLLGGFLAAAYGDAGSGTLGWIVFPVVSLLTISMAVAIWASRPTDWTYAGSNPRHWRGDVDKAHPYTVSLSQQAKLYAAGIIANRDTLNANSRTMRWALFLAVAAIAVGILVTTILAVTGNLSSAARPPRLPSP